MIVMFAYLSLCNSGYSGWQIIDSTPQEEAEAVYHCGPASVEAVRRGEVGFQYDTPFMYCQLNAELCHFQEEENSEWGFIRMASNQYQYVYQLKFIFLSITNMTSIKNLTCL